MYNAETQEKTMIISTPQAKDAVLEIIEKTEWGYAKIAREAGMHPFAVEKLVTGQTKTLTDASIKKINKLYRFVDKHTEPEEG